MCNPWPHLPGNYWDLNISKIQLAARKKRLRRWCWMRRKNVHLRFHNLCQCRNEYITVTPVGFRFRQQRFYSHNSLFRWLKEHFRDPISGTPGSGSTRTPMIQSAYTTPIINIANLDPQAIQRAATIIPDIFTTHC